MLFLNYESLEERSEIIETLIVEDDLKEILLEPDKTNLVEKKPLIPDQKLQSQQPLIGILDT